MLTAQQFDLNLHSTCRVINDRKYHINNTPTNVIFVDVLCKTQTAVSLCFKLFHNIIVTQIPIKVKNSSAFLHQVIRLVTIGCYRQSVYTSDVTM